MFTNHSPPHVPAKARRPDTRPIHRRTSRPSVTCVGPTRAKPPKKKKQCPRVIPSFERFTPHPTHLPSGFFHALPRPSQSPPRDRQTMLSFIGECQKPPSNAAKCRRGWFPRRLDFFRLLGKKTREWGCQCCGNRFQFMRSEWLNFGTANS